MPALYVADGHHRSAAAARVRELRRAANPGHTGEEPYNFFLAVLFPHDQLKILDYNRVVKDLNGLEPEEFLAVSGSVSRWFRSARAAPGAPAASACTSTAAGTA